MYFLIALYTFNIYILINFSVRITRGEVPCQTKMANDKMRFACIMLRPGKCIYETESLDNTTTMKIIRVTKGTQTQMERAFPCRSVNFLCVSRRQALFSPRGGVKKDALFH